MKPGIKALAIALLFVGLVLVNYLASRLPVRLDTTADDIYTLSAGTRSLLGKIEEPVQLEFYFSKNAEGVPVNYKNFGARVEEMLRQYVRASGGKVTLTLINPAADTPEEEKATAAGISPQVIPATGEQIYFGLTAINVDQQKAINAFNPQREAFLEYDISALIYSVQQVTKKKLGLLSSIPLQAPPFNPMMPMQRPPQQGQLVADEWAKSFELVSIEPSATELPADLDALAIIHPQNLSPKLQYAIDQFLLGGQPVFLALDPSSQHFKRQAGQMGMMGGPPPQTGSDLPTLLGGWGLVYDAQQVVGDIRLATPVSTGRGVERFPIWLSFTKANINDQSQATAQLSSLLFIEPGRIALKDGMADLTFTPLVQTSELAGDLPAMTLQFAQPEDVARQLVTSGQKTLAAIVAGKFKSAFPAGAPADTSPPGADGSTPPPAPTTSTPGLKESSGTSTLIVVADTDWLLDDYSVRRFNFLGTQAAEPLNDNLYLASNTIDFLAGSQDLISLRGKGSALRPFTVVADMQTAAQQRYQEKLTALEARISDVQNKLTELQGKGAEGGRLVATPEVQAAIEDFQKQQANLRRERREIRRALREDIDTLELRLALLNMFLVPTGVVALGGLVWWQRRR